MIALSASWYPMTGVPHRHTSPLTPSLLVRSANPRHDARGADNAKRRHYTPTAGIIGGFGVRGNKAGPRDRHE